MLVGSSRSSSRGEAIEVAPGDSHTVYLPVPQDVDLHFGLLMRELAAQYSPVAAGRGLRLDLPQLGQGCDAKGEEGERPRHQKLK